MFFAKSKNFAKNGSFNRLFGSEFALLKANSTSAVREKFAWSLIYGWHIDKVFRVKNDGF
jgi:hypothetical protein